MNEQSKVRRPTLVWVIFVFYMLSAGWTLYSFYLVLSGAIPLQSVQKEYFDSLTSVDWALTTLLFLTNLLGAIFLILLQRWSFFLLTASLVINILMLSWHALSKDWLVAVEGPGKTGMFFGIGLTAAICFYSWRLLKQGFLK